MSKHSKLGTAEGLFLEDTHFRYQEEGGSDLWDNAFQMWGKWAGDLTKGEHYDLDDLVRLVLPKEYLT